MGGGGEGGRGLLNVYVSIIIFPSQFSIKDKCISSWVASTSSGSRLGKGGSECSGLRTGGLTPRFFWVVSLSSYGGYGMKGRVPPGRKSSESQKSQREIRSCGIFE